MTKIPAIEGNIWLNSKPFSQEDFKGRIVLVDFWTYSCVNCQRTIPYLRKLWEKYKKYKFLLIGIHTPEFEFEKDPMNVEKAIGKYKIMWPVVLDNQYKNWYNFSNHYWPAKYLFDEKGNLAYYHFGEGAYQKMEKEIQKLVQKNEKVSDLPAIEEENKKQFGYCFSPTPETYLGYDRGQIANKSGYVYNYLENYLEPENLEINEAALSGKFIVQSQYIETAETGASIILCFKATEVNLVLKSAGQESIAEVLFNEMPLGEENRGDDVNEVGEVFIKDSDKYNLFRSRDFAIGTLRIKAKKGNFQAYAFTFSGCV